MSAARRWRPLAPPRGFEDHGIEIPPGAAGEIRTTCPKCGPTHRNPRDRVLSVNLDKAAWFCHRCEWKGALHLRRVPDPPRFDPPPPPPGPDARKAASLRRTWLEALPLSDPAAAVGIAYLRARGLAELVDRWDLPAGDVLRVHSGLPYFDTADGGRRIGTFPAVLARVAGPDGRTATLHRTYLAPDGAGKAAVPSPKKLASPPQANALRGAAIRLWPANERLAVAEGIETACALRILTGGAPAWAAICAHGLSTLSLPEGLRELTIGADNDANGTGLRAAHGLAIRARRAGIRKVTIHTPRAAGADWLDVLCRRARP